MKPVHKNILTTALLLALMVCEVDNRSVAAQDEQQLRSIRQAFVVMPAYHGCSPVEVKGIYLTGLPLEVVLGQATVENRSAKVITAVKLGWKVHLFPKGAIQDFQCGIPSPDRTLLAGGTPLISLGTLEPNETCHIGPNPLISKLPASKTVFVDFPIIAARQLTSLPVDNVSKVAKYAVALYVSEIHYVDGTIWSIEK
jgi:hypothetical protein